MVEPVGPHPPPPAHPRGWRIPRAGTRTEAGDWKPGRSLPPTPDFRAIDFERLWRGRERVTWVERSVLQIALERADPGCIVEMGCGHGRLSPAVREHAACYVAVDATRSFLLEGPDGGGRRSHKVAANIYRLPFTDGACTAATLVRVFGFLSDPRAALREIHRVLRPGGILVVSFEPRPSIASFLDDVKVGLAREWGEPGYSRTFSRKPVVEVRPSAFPAWAPTRRHFRSVARSAGFEIVSELPTGLEDYRLFRLLPVRLFLAVARAFPNVGGFPSRFVVLRSVSPRDPPQGRSEEGGAPGSAPT